MFALKLVVDSRIECHSRVNYNMQVYSYERSSGLLQSFLSLHVGALCICLWLAENRPKLLEPRLEGTKYPRSRQFSRAIIKQRQTDFVT